MKFENKSYKYLFYAIGDSFWLFVIVFISISKLHGQYSETIVSGRPGQAIGPMTVGKDVFQVQSGFTYNNIGFDGSRTKSNIITNVFRWGVLEHLEVNGLLAWQNDNIQASNFESNNNGISDSQIGLRYNFSINRGWIPTLGFQSRLLLRLQDEEYRRESVGAQFILITNNQIYDRFSVSTNWLMTYSDFEQRPSYGYVINLSHSISDKWGTFIETYGALDGLDVNIDSGLTYLLTNNIQLDISCGFQGDNNISDWFFDTGISWRVDWRKK